MKTRICILIISVIALLGCSQKQRIEGVYIADNKSAVFESIEFDGTVATFYGGLIGNVLPAYNYNVKGNLIYIETHEGVLKFEIVDPYTIKGVVSLVKGDVYKKKK